MAIRPVRCHLVKIVFLADYEYLVSDLYCRGVNDSVFFKRTWFQRGYRYAHTGNMGTYDAGSCVGD